MHRSNPTLARVRKTYNSFRAKYYKRKKLPPASEVYFHWGDLLGRYAETNRYMTDGGWIYEVVLNHQVKSEPRLFALMLLHEMSHISNWKLDCVTREKEWAKEAVRLGKLGAMAEFF